jgi:molybdate transport system substrate-binding protein
MLRRPWFQRGSGLRAACVLSVLAAGCARGTPGPPPKARPRPATITLHVAAASDLQGVLPKLVERYGRVAPGVEVVTTFGASGQLAEQVKAGAPFDLFLSANRAFARDLADERLLDPDSVRPYAVGALALVASRAAGAAGLVIDLADLERPEVKKIAIANPRTAPYGAAARQALERAGLWETLRPKLVIAESVRQALQYVQTGNAEAGLVGRAISEVPEVSAVDVDPGLYDPIVQSLGVVGRSEFPKEAEAFARFLLGDDAAEVFASHGFKRPGPETAGR